MGCRPPGAAGRGEEADPRARCAGRQTPPDAVDGGGERVPLRRPGGPGEPSRPVRGSPTADRLPRLLRARRHHIPTGGRRLPGACLRGLLIPRRPGRAPRPPERAGHDAGVRFARPQAEIQGLKERMGWELIPWYTITDDFDKDFGVGEWHGTTAFVRAGDRIYR